MSSLPEKRRRQEAARAVLWFYSLDKELGVYPGTFVGALLTALNHADPENRHIIAQGWPVLFEANVLATTQITDGITELRLRAEGSE